MIWFYKIPYEFVKSEVQKSYIEYLKSRGCKAWIQDIYFQPAVYFIPLGEIYNNDVIYFLYEHEMPGFRLNFAHKEYHELDKYGYSQWLRGTMQTASLKVVDVKRGDLSGAYKNNCKIVFKKSPNYTLGVTYAMNDCETTWRLYKDMEYAIKKVIFNAPATIVLWGDGSKTVVKAQDGEKYDKEKGVALCYMKKMLGNKSNFNNVFKEWIKPEPSEKNKKEFSSNIVRIKTSNLPIIRTYMQENFLTDHYIAVASGLSIKTVKRALSGCPVLKTTILKICGYFDCPIETTRYIED